MQGEAVKKKKKYVKMKQESQVTQSENSNLVQNGDNLSRHRFDYTFSEIVNHILARILPNQEFTIRLSQKLIFGPQKEVQKLIDQMDDNIRYFQGFIVELEPQKEKQDIDFQFQQQYKAKAFTGKLLQRLIVTFFQGSKYQHQCSSFLTLFKDQQKERLFIRISKNYSLQFLRKIQQKQLGHVIDEIIVSNKPVMRGNRQKLKVQVSRIEINNDEFDRKNFKDFVSKSQKLDLKEFQIIQKKNSHGYTENCQIIMESYEAEKERKLEAFNYYFRHQNFVILPIKNSKFKEELLQKYLSIKNNWLTINLIKGFKSSKWDQKTIIYKIRCNQISKHKTNYLNDYFQAFHLTGLLPKVRQIIDQLVDQINRVPLDEIKQQIFIDCDDEIKDAIKYNQQIRQFLQGYIYRFADTLKQYCSVKSVKFIMRSIKLNICINPGKQSEYHSIARRNLEIQMMKQIVVHNSKFQYELDQQLLHLLKRQKIIILQKKQKQFKYIEVNENYNDTLQRIQEIKRSLKGIHQQSIDIKGKIMLSKYQQQITKLHKLDQFKDIHVADPQTNDNINYTIEFIGQRKICLQFTKQVKLKISDVNKLIGSYYQQLSHNEATFLIGDKQLIDKIHNDCNISILIDRKIKMQALLTLFPGNSNSTVKIIKTSKLQRIPIGFGIFFLGRKQLQKFQQKYLSNMKIKASRMQKNEMIKQKQANRLYQFYYKLQMNQTELISTALDKQQLNLVCFIMPQKQKQKFIKNILTILTSNYNYQNKKYQIIIIQPDQSSDIESIVDIPEDDGIITQEIILRKWYCQRYMYPQSANDKINNAIINGQTKCLLFVQDISIMSLAQNFMVNTSANTITQAKTGIKCPITINDNVISFTHKGYKIQLKSKNQILTVRSNRMYNVPQFYIGVRGYQIDIEKMTQTNIFTGKCRIISKVQYKSNVDNRKYDSKVSAQYQLILPHLILCFEEKDSSNIQKSVNDIKSYLLENTIERNIDISDFTEQMSFELQEHAKQYPSQNQISFRFKKNEKKIEIKSLIEKDINSFQQFIEQGKKYIIKCAQIKALQKAAQSQYPIYWLPQKGQIQTYLVDPTSQQFSNIQKRFTLTKIDSLTRIQNKYLYNKYTKQLQHLTFLNGNKIPKQMKLFHGTSSTDPQTIYGDKQQGFNINYTSETNLLGKGIYFAEKSQYSNTYAHKQKIIGLRSMFFCDVIVGESQLMLMRHSNSQVKDTGIKDALKNLKYQSIKGIHDVSDIYVVYKNKRAYPEYLIKYKI